MPIRAVLWDIDDTIFDYARADRTGMRPHLEAEGLPDGYDAATRPSAVGASSPIALGAASPPARPTARGSAATGCGPSSAGS